jgi:diguanylate cyclase (GGDEF)-like protein
MNSSKSAEFICSLKIKFYKRALFLAALVILFVWVQSITSGPEGLGEVYFLPVFFVFCATSLLLLQKYDVGYLPIFESLAFVLAFLYFTSEFALRVYTAISQPELSFRKFLIWIPIIYGVAFLIYPPQWALRVSILFLVSILLPGIVYGFAKWHALGFKNDLMLLFQIYASGLIYVALFYIIAALKDKISEVDSWATLATSRANTDSLTKAYSRAKIIEILDSYVSSNMAYGFTFSIAFIDVDKMKDINDCNGHAAGDYVLRRIVEVVSGHLRDHDKLGRIGGDEFLLILPGTDCQQAQVIVNRLRQVISETTFENIGKVTVSIGVASKQDGESKETLLARADEDMYKVKEQGRAWAST